VYRIKRRYAHIPSPKGAWFYLGHIPQIVAKLKKGKNFVDIVTDWQTECGLFLVVWRANQPQIFFSHPDALKEVSMAKFPKGFAFSLIKLWRKQRLAGYGLFTINDHVEWKKKRKIYDPLFGRNHIYSLLTPFNKVSKEFLIDELKSQADGTTSVDMKKIFSFITLQIINIVAFGMDLFNDEYVTSLIRPNDLLFLVNNTLEGVVIEFNNPFISYYRPFLGLKYTTTAYQLREVGRYCIMKRIDDINNGRETPLDILTNIISLTRNHENFTIEDLIDDFVTFIAAGQETTSNMLSFTLILLLRHPEVMERVIEEVDAMYDEEEGDEISLNGLEKLTYMNAAFEESLRLYPPGPVISKTTDKVVVLNGYHIPNGTEITVSDDDSFIQFMYEISIDVYSWSLS
jgi:cytochrome P450